MHTGETYQKSRLHLAFSKAKVSALAKRAGYTVTESAISRLESIGGEAVGPRKRDLTFAAVAWLEYLYGMSDPAGIVDWSTVEPGAPVVIHGETGTFAFHAVENDGHLTLWGGRRNKERYRTFPPMRVRLVSPTAMPAEELASSYRIRERGADIGYGLRIMDYMRAHPSAHSIGSLAYTLGLDNAAVSRVAAALAKKGELCKVHRGVFVLAEESPETVKAALAERVLS